MNRGGKPSVGAGESVHRSETTENYYYHSPSNPSNSIGRGRGRGKGRGKSSRREGTWQPCSAGPENSSPARRDGRNPSVHHPQFLSQYEADMMRSLPTRHIPPQRPFLPQTRGTRPLLPTTTLPPPNYTRPPTNYTRPPMKPPLMQMPPGGPLLNPCYFNTAGIIDRFGNQVEQMNTPQGTHIKTETSEDTSRGRNQASNSNIKSQKTNRNTKKNDKAKKDSSPVSTNNLKSKSQEPALNDINGSQPPNVDENTQILLKKNENAQEKKKDTLQMSAIDKSESKKFNHDKDSKETQSSSLENVEISVRTEDLLQDEVKDEVALSNEESVVEMKDDHIRPPLSTKTDLTLTNQTEIKDSSVPVNFGIKLLNSLVHNNIELVADQGAVIRANSVILSLNSPVIHHMTTVLELNRIEMKEFREHSVRYFVESVYTGKLPAVRGDMFRDLHKISHAFKVKWLQLACFEMFSEFTSAIPDTSPPYEDLFFLFEEAAYVLSKLKQRNFLAVALGKIISSGSRQIFIEKYLVDIEQLSDYHLDMVVELAGVDVDLFVRPLKEQLLKQLGVEGTVISSKCKYLLENCDLTPCRQKSSDLFEQLFDVLQELAVVSSEDMKWVLQLHRKSANKPTSGDTPTSGDKPTSGDEPTTGDSGKGPKSEKKSFWFWQKNDGD